MPRSGPVHAYPEQLASFVVASLHQAGLRPVGLALPEDEALIESALSVAYQTSLLRDEDRPLTFRLAITPADAFDPGAGPPHGVHPLALERPRVLAVHELRKLVSAVKYPRSIVAICRRDDTLAIWGMLHTGPRWLQTVRGGRAGVPDLPHVLVVHVNGPGNLVVTVGSRTIARLYAGELTIPMVDVFDSSWLPRMFDAVRGEIEAIYRAERDAGSDRSHGGALPAWPDVDMDLVRRIGQGFTRRIISTIRNARHGGSILIVPPQRLVDIRDEGLIELKYAFQDGEPRRRFRTLVLSALRTLAEEKRGRVDRVGWSDYVASQAPAILDLDEAIMEMAYLISGLADVDGLVVMTQRFEVIGFGGIVSGRLPEIATVAHSIDLEGTTRVDEPTDGVGTRHRAAYRICAAMPEALCIVVSQDGGVRFVRCDDGQVTVWEQVAVSAFG
jgi:hypothetical protein